MSWKTRATPVSSGSSWKDRASPVTKEEESSLLTDAYDTAKGVGQGLTFGGGDELLGGLQASKDVLIGDKSLSDWADQYRSHQQENEDEYNKAKERSPVLTTAGEIAGGLALPAGSIGLAGKGLSTAGKIALGAGTGAVAGALGSEGNLEENPSEMAKDAAFGATVGAVAEPAVKLAGLAGKGIQKLASPYSQKVRDFVNDYSLLRQGKKAIQEGLEGRTFTGKKNQERLVNESIDAADQLESTLTKGQDFASKQYDDVLKDANFTFSPEQASKFDETSNILETMKGRTGASNTANLEVLAKIKANQPVSAQEVKNLQKYLRDNAGKINQGETMDELIGASKEANEALRNNVPGYSKVNDLFQKVESPIESFISNVPADKRTVKVNNRIDTDITKPYTTAKDVIEKSEGQFGKGQKQFEQVLQLRKGLEELQSTHPEALKQMGIDNLDNFFSKIQDQSDLQAIADTIRTGGSLEKNPISALKGFGVGAAYNVGNLAGKTANATGNITAKMGQSLYKLPTQALSPIAQKLESNPSTAHLGKALRNSIDETTGNKSSAMRNAALFSIMQNPKAREIVFGEETPNEQQ
jgi:hypothetical protein